MCMQSHTSFDKACFKVDIIICAFDAHGLLLSGIQ